jgi:hypothetical protein
VLRFRTMRFARALPIDSREGSGRPCIGSRRVPVAAALRNAPPRGLARPRCGSGRMPFATALWTDSAPASSPTLETSRLPYPWRLHGSETSSKSRLLVAASAHPLRHLPGVGLAPHNDSALQLIRLGSQVTLTALWQPPVATACLHPRPSLARESPHRHEVPAWTSEDPGSSSEEPAPNRSTHGRATRSAPHKRSTQRLESSTLPPKATRRHRWVETRTRKRTVRDSARRREASCHGVRPGTVRRAHSARPRPKARNVWGSSTDR